MFWITLLSILLVAVGVFAEINLMCRFVRDWLVGRREERGERAGISGAGRQPGATGSSRGGRSRGPAAVLAVLSVTGVHAFGQAITVEPLWVGGPLALSEQPAEAPKVEPPKSEATTAEAPKEEAKPLLISTDRPSFSDTAGIVPTWHLQIESGWTFTFRNRQGTETQTNNAPEILARFGVIDDRLELRLTTSGYVWSRSDANGSGFEDTHGWSDLSPGFKLKLTDQDHLLPRLCLEGGTTLSLGSRGISNRDVEPFGKLIWSYDLGKGFGVYGNGNITYASTNGARFIQGAGSICFTYAPSDYTSFFLEYYVIGPNVKGSDAAHYIDGGVAHLITNRIQLDARVGFGLNQEANNVFTGVGISFLF